MLTQLKKRIIRPMKWYNANFRMWNNWWWYNNLP
jgi:hypothetical protein